MRPISEGPDIPERVPPALLRAWATKLRQLQVAHDRAVARAQAAQRRVALLIRQRALYQAELSRVNAQIAATQETVTRKKADVAALSAQVDEHRTARDAATARLLGTDRLSGTVTTTYPLLLFPVRVETRFAARRTGPGTDLLLRVYPDDIHLDSHEPALTEEEEHRGKDFWAHVAAAPTGTDRQEHIRQGWQRLTEQFGTTRAAWIAHVLDPAQPGTVARRDDSWTRASHTQVLPDRWVAVGYRSDTVRVTAWGKAIPETVAVGPDPRGTGELGSNGMPPVDDGMKWITDFDTADSIGMGLRIPITEEDANAGFDRIVVLGLKASWDAPTTADRLVRLFDAHHYTGSLALVEQQVPTNNTAEASAGYRSTGRDAADSMGVELGASLLRSGSDGELLAQALGLPTSVFAHVRGADGSEQRRSSLMQSALLALCDSPLLRQLLGAAGADVLRDHFTKYVRARGPLPVLRVDNQPYGLLPVAAFNRWISAPGQDQDQALAAWWHAQRLTRRRQASQALQTTVESNPVVFLAQEANASRYTLREFPEVSTQQPPLPKRLLSEAFRTLLLTRALSTPHEPAWDDVTALPEPVRQQLLAEVMDLLTYRLDAWGTSLATRRLAVMRQAAPSGIRLGAYGWVEQVRRAASLQPVPALPAGVPAPVLRSERNKGFVHAPSLGHAAAAAVLRSGYLSQESNRAPGASPFAVDLSSERVHRAKWLLDGVRQGQSLTALLGYRFERHLHERGLDRYIQRFRALTSFTDTDRFADIRDALTRAERLAHEVTVLTVQRDQALRRAEDARGLKAERERRADTYRVELGTIATLVQQAQVAQAQVAQAVQVLAQQQAAKPQGKVIQSTVRRYAVQLLEARDLDEWDNRVEQLTQAHTTALAQATAAQQAVSARDGSRLLAERAQAKLLNAADPDSIPAAQQMAVGQETLAAELDRQVLAKEGGQRGQAMSDLLAARDTLTTRLAAQWNEALKSLPAATVVDGLALHRRWTESQQRQAPQSPWDVTTIPFGNATLGFPPPGSPDFMALVETLKALDDLVDSVGDSVVAESVYQLVQGNPLRSGATLDAIAAGEVPPPELDVIRTPRSGVGLTHRLCTLFPATDGTAPAGWPLTAPSARAQAEPILNAWVATLLPNPARVRCKADYVNQQDGQVYHTVENALTSLGLAPLDAVYLAEGSTRAQQAELEQRWRFVLQQTRPTTVPPDAIIRLQFGRGNGWSAEIVSVSEWCEVATTVRRLLSNARSLDGRDLSLPESPADSGLNHDEFADRATRAVQALADARARLDGFLPPPSSDDLTANLDEVRRALFGLANYGIPSAVPTDIGGTGPEARSLLLTQARSVVLEAQRRLNRVAESEQDFVRANAMPEERRDHDLARLRIIFGQDFLALPRVIAANATQLNETFAAGLSLQGQDPMAAVTWFQRAAYVRPGATRLNEAMLYAETVGSAALRFHVGQLPFQTQDRWVALPQTPDKPFPRGRLSLVAQVAAAQLLRFDQAFCGLLIDEWVETVPSPKETTGLAFHYDQPNNAPPQALLLAVPADQRTTWDLNSLEALMHETMDLARLRAVAPDSGEELIWVEDQLPEGATPLGDGEGWAWVRAKPEPLSGTRAHQSVFAAGIHQHFFQGAKLTMFVSVGDRLFAHVYLDPARMPRQVMLQWHAGNWDHRVYWGENLIPWGTDNTVSRQYMGPLPPPGRWVRLEVPAETVGLEGRIVEGMAFTLFDGMATWDRSGKRALQPVGSGEQDPSAPALFFTGGTLDFTSVID
ncbi:MAG: hypothetical protein OEW35_18120, partial [Gammaproteobacteria bacterium]|nr:hypothetical protein [Gammaproteobacteria bacterium]